MCRGDLTNRVSDVWTDLHRIRHNKRRDQHPCQLPEPLLERLVLMTTEPGDIVLDPFVGAGTTAIAAKRLGRAYIGIDIDPAYVQITTEKLSRTEPTTINGCYISQFLGKVVTLRDKDYPLLKAHFGTKVRKIENHPHSHQETFFDVAA